MNAPAGEKVISEAGEATVQDLERWVALTEGIFLILDSLPDHFDAADFHPEMKQTMSDFAEAQMSLNESFGRNLITLAVNIKTLCKQIDEDALAEQRVAR